MNSEKEPSANSATLSEISHLHSTLLKLREQKRLHESDLKLVNDEIAGKESSLISYLQQSGLTSFKTDEGSVTIQRRFSVRLPESQTDWEKFFDYLKSLGHYDSMRTVNSQRLNAWYKTELEQHKEKGEIDWAPPGLKEPSVNEFLSFRK